MCDRAVVTTGRITREEDCRGDIKPELGQRLGDGESGRERERRREIEDGRENADPHSRNARYSGGIARNCCTLSASFLDCGATRLFSFLFSRAPASRPTNRPPDTRVRGRACTRYISRTRDEQGASRMVTLTLVHTFPSLRLSASRPPVPHMLLSTFRGGKVDWPWLEIYRLPCTTSPVKECGDDFRGRWKCRRFNKIRKELQRILIRILIKCTMILIWTVIETFQLEVKYTTILICHRNVLMSEISDNEK